MKTISIDEATKMYDEFLDIDYEECPEAWLNVRISTSIKELFPNHYKIGLPYFLDDHNLKL